MSELDPGLLAAWREVLPEASAWVSRDPETLLKGAVARLDNISELWDSLAQRDIAVPEARDLFEDVEFRMEPVEIAESADEALAHVRTQSDYLRLDSARQRRLSDRISALVESRGGTLRPTTVVAVATARTRA